MEKCIHVSKIRPAWDHSILNPVKWLCFTCRTTESVWACLSCSNVACGRFNEQHALKHFKESKHPISIEVNDKYVYCYVCDDYVLNDNAAGDIKLLRSALSAIATQKFTDIESRGRRLLRSYSHSGVIKRDHADDDDKLATADWHQRQRLLGKVFGAWRTYVHNIKQNKQKSPKKEKKKLETFESISLKKRTITPGVTGLRNLGNTCYMNSVLQVLSHIDAFRNFFLSLKDLDSSPSLSPQTSSSLISSSVGSMTSSPPKPSKSPISKLMSKLSPTKPCLTAKSSIPRNQLLLRQTTVECFQHLMSTRSQTKNGKRQQKGGGLNGGSSQPPSKRRQHLICEVEAKGTEDKNVSLCSELHGLFRVLWSGKWAQVSPHAFLQAVWQTIPMFKGYFQHDAQEFLCELLDKVQHELDGVPRPLRREDAQLVTELFQGELVSQVTCLSCRSVSQTNELFLDLSLEFPDRYQITKQNSRIAQDICHLTEMLAKFTEIEYLEGQIYACEKCNSKKGKNKEKIYTEARKQLLINKLPQILRLHLKRFRWSGRFHREKISTHVAVDENLNLSPFCTTTELTSHEYQLFAVIIHHGKGFGSGHYTAYTWNQEAESWVNCNDSRMILSSIEEVLKSQAYILFYRAVTDKLPLLTKYSSSVLSLSSNQSVDSLPPTLSSSNQSVDSLPQTLISEDTLPYEPTVCVPHKLKTEDTVILSHRQGDVRKSAKMKLRSSIGSSDCDAVNIDIKQEKKDLDSKNSTVKFVKIDKDISYRQDFYSNPSKKDESKCDQKLVERKRTVKHSLDSSEPPGKMKKLSFSTDMFYTKGVVKPNVISKSKGSQLKSSLKKLDKYLPEPPKMTPKSPGHVRRRKSTFW